MSYYNGTEQGITHIPEFLEGVSFSRALAALVDARRENEILSRIIGGIAKQFWADADKIESMLALYDDADAPKTVNALRNQAAYLEDAIKDAHRETDRWHDAFFGEQSAARERLRVIAALEKDYSKDTQES
jgi:hypothetical protein